MLTKFKHTILVLTLQQYASKMLKNLLLTKPPTEMLGKSKSKCCNINCQNLTIVGQVCISICLVNSKWNNSTCLLASKNFYYSNNSCFVRSIKHKRQLYETCTDKTTQISVRVYNVCFVLLDDPALQMWTEDTIKMCLFLYLGLLPNNHKLIHQ